MLNKMKMLLIICMLVQISIKAESSCSTVQTELGLCQKLTNDLKTTNSLLEQKVSILTRQRDAAEAEVARTSNPLLPTWTWVIIGVAVGAGTIIAIKH